MAPDHADGRAHDARKLEDAHAGRERVRGERRAQVVDLLDESASGTAHTVAVVFAAVALQPQLFPPDSSYNCLRTREAESGPTNSDRRSTRTRF